MGGGGLGESTKLKILTAHPEYQWQSMNQRFFFGLKQGWVRKDCKGMICYQCIPRRQKKSLKGCHCLSIERLEKMEGG